MLFAAHESFHIREGWLRKGLLGIERNPLPFSWRRGMKSEQDVSVTNAFTPLAG